MIFAHVASVARSLTSIVRRLVSSSSSSGLRSGSGGAGSASAGLSRFRGQPLGDRPGERVERDNRAAHARPGLVEPDPEPGGPVGERRADEVAGVDAAAPVAVADPEVADA